MKIVVKKSESYEFCLLTSAPVKWKHLRLNRDSPDTEYSPDRYFAKEFEEDVLDRLNPPTPAEVRFSLPARAPDFGDILPADFEELNIIHKHQYDAVFLEGSKLLYKI